MKVLIVDDSSIMRKILQRSLSKSSALDIDFYVEATDGGDAMEKFESDGPFNLIFSDIKMPNVDGLEFLKKNDQVLPTSCVGIMFLNLTLLFYRV